MPFDWKVTQLSCRTNANYFRCGLANTISITSRHYQTLVCRHKRKFWPHQLATEHHAINVHCGDPNEWTSSITSSSAFSVRMCNVASQLAKTKCELFAVKHSRWAGRTLPGTCDTFFNLTTGVLSFFWNIDTYTLRFKTTGTSVSF